MKYRGYFDNEPKDLPMGYVLRQVGPGWAKIVRELIASIDAVAPETVLLDLKEKFGTLRFYCDSVAPGAGVHALVVEAEARSAETCELCGQPGTLGNDGRGWEKCLCAEHHALRATDSAAFAASWKSASDAAAGTAS